MLPACAWMWDYILEPGQPLTDRVPEEKWHSLSQWASIANNSSWIHAEVLDAWFYTYLLLSFPKIHEYMRFNFWNQITKSHWNESCVLVLFLSPGLTSLSMWSMALRLLSLSMAFYWWWKVSSQLGPSRISMGTSKSPPVADVWAPGYVISLHSV